jgi:transposase
MEVVYSRCCGLDIHKKTVVACRILPGPQGGPAKEIKTFGTMTADLLALSDWLTAGGVTHVAMESTGVYWKPLYNLLEGNFTLLLVNAQHLSRVPGRKSDVADSEWLADLLRHGLVKASFVPERDQRELRELTRSRTSLIRERAAEVNRLQKVLEGANLKLAAVASDVTGKSAREMLTALVSGETDPTVLAEMAKGRLREKIPLLEQALRCQFGAHQQFLVTRQLAHLDYLDGVIAELDAEVAKRVRPFEAAVDRLQTINGVGRRIAEIVVAEIGTDMSRFPTDAHLASWAGMCPGQQESAGKRQSGKTRKGSPWLRSALVQAAHAVRGQRDTYAGAQYRRLASRRGAKRAAIAVGHAQLVAAYHILKDEVEYHDLGGQYFDERDRQGVVRRSVKRLESLGYQVDLQPALAAA